MIPAFGTRVCRGTWTPTLTFATPGDLAVGYAEQKAYWDKITPSLIYLDFHILTNAFTWTTAAGNLKVTGFPWMPSSQSLYTAVGACRWQGITFAAPRVGATQVVARVTNTTEIFFDVSGSGIASSQVAAADMPSGGTVMLRASMTLRIGD